MAMVEAAARLADRGGVAVTHQTGERDLARVRDGYRQVAGRVIDFCTRWSEMVRTI